NLQTRLGPGGVHLYNPHPIGTLPLPPLRLRAEPKSLRIAHQPLPRPEKASAPVQELRWWLRRNLQARVPAADRAHIRPPETPGNRRSAARRKWNWPALLAASGNYALTARIK